MNKEKYDIHVEGAKEKFATWIADRGGVAVWKDQSLSRRGGNMFTPADQTGEPQWGYARADTVTSIEDFRFSVGMREVKRFRVAIRISSNGMMLKLTDAASEKLNKALDVAGPDAVYTFDYDTQEAVISLPIWEELK